MSRKVYKRLRVNVRPPAAGKHVLLMIANYWGKGKSLKVAFDNLCELSGRYTCTTHTVAYHCHPETTVESVFGGIVSPKGHPPTKVAAINKPHGKARVTEVY